MSLIKFIPGRQGNNGYYFVIFLVLSAIIVSSVEAYPTFSPYEGKSPLEVTFTFPGGDSCNSVKWTFGDGNNTTKISPVHTYYGLGMYYPTCTCELPGSDISYTYDSVYVIPWESSIRPNKGGGNPINETVNRTSEGLSAPQLQKQAEGLMAIGEIKYATDAFADLYKMGKMERNLVLEYGDAEKDLNNFAKAEELYSEAISDSEDDTVLKKLAFVQYKQNNFNDSINTINKVISHSSSDSQAYSSLAEMLYSAGDKNESLKAFNKSVALNDNQPEIWKEYADLLAETAHISEAADAYKHTIDLGLSNKDVWSKYSTVLQKLGRKEEAQSAKERAVNTYGPIAIYTSDDSIPVCSVGSLC